MIPNPYNLFQITIEILFSMFFLGQQCISTYKQFTAIQQLAVKLQDTLELTEEQLDVALSKVISSFKYLFMFGHYLNQEITE